MDKDEMSKKIREDEDYIRCPKASNSLNKFLLKNSEEIKNVEEIDDLTISKLLMIPKDEVKRLYEDAVNRLREEMSKESEED